MTGLSVVVAVLMLIMVIAVTVVAYISTDVLRWYVLPSLASHLVVVCLLTTATYHACVIYSGINTANLCTTILDFRGFDSSIILILRGGIPRPMGNFPEISSQRIFVGRCLVGRLGILASGFVSASLLLNGHLSPFRPFPGVSPMCFCCVCICVCCFCYVICLFCIVV